MKRSHLWILTALLLVSCGGDDDGTGPPPPGGNNDLPDPVPTAVGTPNGAPTTETIGAGGGSVASSDGAFTLNIPAGALASDTDITVEPITNTAWGGIGAGYRLTPDGLTFSQPVTLTFDIAPEMMAGSAPEALDVAFQNDAGFWYIVRNGAYDAGSGTLTCTTTHFTDFTAIEEYVLRPVSAGLSPSSTITLRVDRCFYATVASDEDAEMQVLTCSGDGDDLAVLIAVSNWSVNGVQGGNTTVGKINELGNGEAKYTAPVAVPAVNPVAVSARVDVRRGSATYLVSNIQISSGYAGTITDNGQDNGHDVPDKSVWNVEWTSDGAIGNVESFTGTGTVTYTLPDQIDCPSESITPNSGTINSGETWMTINRGVDPPLIIIHCGADWDARECYQCLTDPEYCTDLHFFIGFADNLGTLSSDGNTITGYFLDLDSGENHSYQFTRPAPPTQ